MAKTNDVLIDYENVQPKELTLLRKQLSEQELTALLDALCGMVKIDGLKVAYDLPGKVAIPVSP